MATKHTIFKDNQSQLALKFANDLWSEIVDKALFSRPKNDICDYLLYLFNKHDSAHFLDSNSNEKNERLLKMNASKIKSTKKNIAIKFMDSDEYEKIFNTFINKEFKEKLNTKKVLIKGDKFYFVIENRALRDIIEARLKDKAQDTLDYSFNSERVFVSIDSFFAILEDKVPEDKIESYKATINKLKRKYKIKKGIEILSITASFIADMCSILDFVNL